MGEVREGGAIYWNVDCTGEGFLGNKNEHGWELH